MKRVSCVNLTGSVASLRSALIEGLKNSSLLPSSRVLREEFSFIKSRTPSLWTMKYCILTDNGDNVSNIVQQYVEAQELRG